MPQSDNDLLRALAQRIMRLDQDVADRARAMQPAAAAGPAAGETGLEGLVGGDELPPVLETIVVREGRPVLHVSNDDYVVEGDGTDREARRKYFSIGPRMNITSQVKRGTYSKELCAGESFRIKAKVSAKRSAGRRVDTQVQAESDRDSFQRTGDLCTHRLRL